MLNLETSVGAGPWVYYSIYVFFVFLFNIFDIPGYGASVVDFHITKSEVLKDKIDPGPEVPINVTGMLKFGTNLLQVVGQFNGRYAVLVVYMSFTPLFEDPILQDYLQSAVTSIDSTIITMEHLHTAHYHHSPNTKTTALHSHPAPARSTSNNPNTQPCGPQKTTPASPSPNTIAMLFLLDEFNVATFLVLLLFYGGGRLWISERCPHTTAL
ncbi:hypothetical protein JHK87_044621 [Glycine soja]|nr:hypothetical protein JHK87_044621 [Glycine soja]